MRKLVLMFGMISIIAGTFDCVDAWAWPSIPSNGNNIEVSNSASGVRPAFIAKRQSGTEGMASQSFSLYTASQALQENNIQALSNIQNSLDVRMTAAYNLGEQNNGQAVNTLITQANNPQNDVNLRKECLLSLVKIDIAGAASVDVVKNTVQVLCNLALDQNNDENLRSAALFAISNIDFSNPKIEESDMSEIGEAMQRIEETSSEESKLRKTLDGVLMTIAIKMTAPAFAEVGNTFDDENLTQASQDVQAGSESGFHYKLTKEAETGYRNEIGLPVR